MTRGQKDCEICGNPASFMRVNKKEEPPEGEVCTECDRWVCEDCVDWKNSPPPVCKECSP